MVTVALYLALLASVVADVPNGSSVAFRPSVLRETATFVTCVVPVEVTLKSLKVDLVTVDFCIFSEKVVVTLAPGETPVALARGAVPLTAGFVVSAGGVSVGVSRKAWVSYWDASPCLRPYPTICPSLLMAVLLSKDPGDAFENAFEDAPPPRRLRGWRRHLDLFIIDR